MLYGFVFLCALLAITPALIRIGLGIALLLACFACLWLAGAAMVAITLELVRKATYR